MKSKLPMEEEDDDHHHRHRTSGENSVQDVIHSAGYGDEDEAEAAPSPVMQQEDKELGDRRKLDTADIETPSTPDNDIEANDQLDLADSLPPSTPQPRRNGHDHHPPRPASPSESLTSLPDDTISIQGSILSSPGSSILPSRPFRPDVASPTASFRPFDRRFSSRLSPSPGASPRSSSPAFLKGHSRNTSLASQINLDTDDTDTSTPPWEVVRWTKLKKLNNQTFSEAGRRNFGAPTCIAVSQNIVVGTSKGIILVFDNNQSLKSIIGLATKAVESGPVTSIAISADYNTVAGGHANGDIFTWDTLRSAKPFLHIPPLSTVQTQNRKVDGHYSDVAVTHLGFLGTRHTALVSANDHGMAFSHLASRGTGSLGRSVNNTRILGRYPDDKSSLDKPRKPSTILAFASLPLGNVERLVDALGLTAILTPYLLVIVSTTPIAQTQHKASRPREVAAHSAMSGCLAWFPAVKLKVKDAATGHNISRVKLVYCWSNVLTVLEVEEEQSADPDKPPNLFFRARSRWKAEEAIVAVQWLSRSVLAILTITQRLIILEDNTMRMTEAFDLIGRHIFHQDLFSKQLHNLVERLDETDISMHGVVADAFYMSFKAYKGKMFILGFGDVSVGALSNWADRLVALMEHGDYIAAITLASTYYTGDADKLTIGLPENQELRHVMVKDKLIDIMTASLKYALGRDRIGGSEGSGHLRELCEACFVASLSIQSTDYLLDDVYEWFDEADEAAVFFETLEPYIQSQQVTILPPIVVKALVSHYVVAGLESRLEDMICMLETATLDLDEVTTLCKQHNLYDALIYVWNRAIGDYITPLIELLTLLKPLQNGDYFANGNSAADPIYGINALKIFPYLSYTFTGRRYPTGDTLTERDADSAKAELYWFLFSGTTVEWPSGSGKPFHTLINEDEEPSFPYLRMILKYDAPSFLSSMNEAFEDSFLNDLADSAFDGSPPQEISEALLFGRSINRQYIVSILLEVMNHEDFASEETIYLDMFIARNLPKFPQYLLLSGTSLHNVLTGLCRYPGEDLAEDAQLSAEYLLSTYHPSDLASLLPLFREARFYRVLKSIYRTEEQYAKLIETYFEDENDRHEVFVCIADCLGRSKSLTKKQKSEVFDTLRKCARQLISLDASRAAQIVDSYAPDLQEDFLNSIEDLPETEYTYLYTILEKSVPDRTQEVAKPVNNALLERYVQLMCQFNPSHVVDFVNSIKITDLRLDKVLPVMEDSGVVDAAVVLMARDGQAAEAMQRLVQHFSTLEAALVGVLEPKDNSDNDISVVEEATGQLLESLQNYIRVGIWLCTALESRTFRRSSNTGVKREASGKTDALSADELLWLDLIDATVHITKSVSTALTDLNSRQPESQQSEQFTAQLLSTLRTTVQNVFTALLTATSSKTTTEHRPAQSLSFLHILRAFLTRASLSSPSLSDLRSVLSSIFSAYTFESNILSLANRLLDKDLYVNIKDANEKRLKGWRSRGSVCEVCRKRVWGAGAGGNILEKWEGREKQRILKEERKRAVSGGDEGVARGKGVDDQLSSDNGKDDVYQERSRSPGKRHNNEEGHNDVDEANNNDEQEEEDLGPIVLFACRHLYHKLCLERISSNGEVGVDAGNGTSGGREEGVFRCPSC